MDDLLDESNVHGYLWWCTSLWNPLEKHFISYELEPEMIKSIMNNDSVQREILKIPLTLRSSIGGEIGDIIKELTHNFSPNSIRQMGFVLTKTFKQLYDHIYVDRAAVELIRSLSDDGVPTLYLPTHRSYMDFLILPWVCFLYRLPLPVVAAAMDFSSMAVVSDIMRRCGAFFIRRKVSDRLYSAVLRAYVQHLALTCSLPMEFFIEGTRSRSGKSLPPKTGFLQVYMDIYKSGRVPDVRIVPVSISYDRILEENLFTREMLGVPKPRESTGGLVRALTVLSDGYGDVCVRFHAPLSLRQLAQDRPEQLALRVLQCHMAESAVTSCNVMSAALQLLSGRALVPHVQQLAQYISQQLHHMYPQLKQPVLDGDTLRRITTVHGGLFRVEEESTLCLRDDDVSSAYSVGSSSFEAAGLAATTLNWSASRVLMQFYINPILPLLAGLGLRHLAGKSGVSEVLLRQLMLCEFPVLRLTATNGVTDSGTNGGTNGGTGGATNGFRPGHRWTEMCAALVKPYLQAYHVIVDVIIQVCADEVDVARLQTALEARCDRRHGFCHLYLSRDVIQNCINSLVKMQAGRKLRRGSGTVYTWSDQSLRRIHSQLSSAVVSSSAAASKL